MLYLKLYKKFIPENLHLYGANGMSFVLVTYLLKAHLLKTFVSQLSYKPFRLKVIRVGCFFLGGGGSYEKNTARKTQELSYSLDMETFNHIVNLGVLYP